MSRIDELIAEYSPEGVQYRKLGELAAYEQPGKYLVDSIDYSDSFPTPVLTAGQTFILGYTNESAGIYPASPSSPVVIFDDFTTAFKWVDFPFKAKSSAMKIITSKKPELATLRYVYYAMQAIAYIPQDHARQWIGTYSQFEIPVPPLEVQQEIVRILDQFTQLETELEAELEVRQQQYDFYRRMMLKRVNAESVSLASLGRWQGGITPSKSDSRYWTNGNIPWLASMDVSNESTDEIRGRVTEAALRETSLKIVPAPSVAVVMRSNILRRRLPIGLVKVGTTVNQDMRALIPREGVDAEYVYQVLRADSDKIRSKCVRTDGSMAAVNSQDFFAWEILLPPIEDQRRVATELRSFASLVNDRSVGIPAELAARRKQYEYYRDKLLTFEEATV